MSPSALLIHVPDVTLGVEWRQKAFPKTCALLVGPQNIIALDVNGFSLEVVQADAVSDL